MKKFISIKKIGTLFISFLFVLPNVLKAQSFTDATLDVAALPVQWISFTGNATSNGVQLQWTTANEFNNSHFNIQKSSNGINFSTIGKIDGTGNSSSLTNYSFLDSTSLNSIVYYRLQQVDIDGKTSVSSVLVIKNELQSNTLLNIYPNPISGNKLVVNFKNVPVGIYTLSIKNINGVTIHQQVYPQQIFNTNTQIQMASKPASGWYVMSMINEKGEVVALKTLTVK